MNLLELFVKIGVDDQASSQIETIADKLESGLETAAKIGTAAVGAASTAVVALTKNAVDNYAEYEQLVGGVETLFKESSDALKQYAANAFETAGMSANGYMETATSFAASLLQSLEGDTASAVEYSNMAITDMSDNANKMGTDISMLQNAYSGFARGTYTMLDNLKLGYAGSSAEMYRLLEDAASLNEEFANTAEFSIDGVGHLTAGFADIVKAIHIVQNEIGITGTTAKEASTTISGSLSSAKSAYSNLLTGMADDNANFGVLVDNFVESVGIAAENIVPRVEIALSGTSKLIEELFPVVMDQIPTIMDNVVPDVVDSAVAIVDSLIEGLTENQDSLVDTAFEITMILVDSLNESIPKVAALGINITGSLAEGIIESLPDLMEAATETIITLAEMLLDPELMMDITVTATEILITLVDGLIDAIPELVDAATEIILNLVDYMLDPGNQKEMITLGWELVAKIAAGLIEGVVELGSAVLTLISEIAYKFGDTDWISIGKDVVFGILDGLKNAWKSLASWFTDAWDGIVGSVKDFLGIHSPSRVFADIGKNMALGVGEGWSKAFDGISDDITSSMDFDRSVRVTSDAVGRSKANAPISVVQNIYASKMSPSEVLNEALYYQKKAVLFGV